MSSFETKDVVYELHAEAQRLSHIISVPSELRTTLGETKEDGFWFVCEWQYAVTEMMKTVIAFH